MSRRVAGFLVMLITAGNAGLLFISSLMALSNYRVVLLVGFSGIAAFAIAAAALCIRGHGKRAVLVSAAALPSLWIAAVLFQLGAASLGF